MYRRSRFRHTLSSRPWAGRQNLVYGFSVGLARRQAGTFIPLSPSLGLSYERAETALLNKFVEISTTAGRFCSRCRLFCLFTVRARLPGRPRAYHEETRWYAERDSNPQDPASGTGMCTGFIICTSEGVLPGRRPPGLGRRTRHVVLLEAPASCGSRTRPKLLNR